jgi:hypothetical protein
MGIAAVRSKRADSLRNGRQAAKDLPDVLFDLCRQIRSTRRQP